MRHIGLISGKDSFCAVAKQIERNPDLPYELVHNEVGWDLPESLEWIQRVGVYLGRPIIKCGDELSAIVEEQNCLPTATRRYCTKYAKIRPLNEMLGTTPATVYFGLRADEPDRVGYVVPPRQKLVPAYPLRDIGYGLVDVWRWCESVGLLPPTFPWSWMEARVRELLGRDEYLLDAVEPWERAALLAWRSRNNCDRCFYARLYEKVGFYEHYPERFEDACQMEERYGWNDFCWAKGYRLRSLIPRADAIKEKRAKSIVKHLRTRQQGSLFEDDPLTDELAVTSCGLLCGK